jgi:hypothetical protein
MNQTQLRVEFTRLTKEQTIVKARELLQKYCDAYFQVLKKHIDDPVSSGRLNEGKLMLQMVFSKLVHLKKMFEGVGFKATDGTGLADIIDPTINAVMVRNLYETVAAFNFVYTYYNDVELENISYNLWVIAGLKYRQRFEANLTEGNEGSKAKLDDEKREIDRLLQEILDSNYFRALGEKQKVIKDAIRKKEFKVLMDNAQAEILSWTDVHKRLSWKPMFFDTTYNYFSLYAHPSNVSVFQYQDLFDKSTKPFEQLSLLNLTYIFILASIFLAEYIKVFPGVLNTFNNLSVLDQILIDHYNMFGRSHDQTINGAYQALG